MEWLESVAFRSRRVSTMWMEVPSYSESTSLTKHMWTTSAFDRICCSHQVTVSEEVETKWSSLQFPCSSFQQMPVTINYSPYILLLQDDSQINLAAAAAAGGWEGIEGIQFYRLPWPYIYASRATDRWERKFSHIPRISSHLSNIKSWPVCVYCWFISNDLILRLIAVLKLILVSKWFCLIYVYFLLDTRGTLTPVISYPSMVWLIRPIIDTYCRAIWLQ